MQQRDQLKQKLIAGVTALIDEKPQTSVDRKNCSSTNEKSSDHPFSFTDNQIELFLDYLALLIKWNKAYNLTAIRDPFEMLTLHLLDSLSILPFVTKGPVIDVGTGAGLPGIPLAIAKPDIDFTLLDSNGKKVRFLREVKRQLKLPNIFPIQNRAEAENPSQVFKVITTRAFADLNKMWQLTKQLGNEQSLYFAMKGQIPETEFPQLRSEVTIQATYPLTVPGLNAERHLVVLTKVHK